MPSKPEPRVAPREWASLERALWILGFDGHARRLGPAQPSASSFGASLRFPRTAPTVSKEDAGLGNRLKSPKSSKGAPAVGVKTGRRSARAVRAQLSGRSPMIAFEF